MKKVEKQPYNIQLTKYPKASLNVKCSQKQKQKAPETNKSQIALAHESKANKNTKPINKVDFCLKKASERVKSKQIPSGVIIKKELTCQPKQQSLKSDKIYVINIQRVSGSDLNFLADKNKKLIEIKSSPKQISEKNSRESKKASINNGKSNNQQTQAFKTIELSLSNGQKDYRVNLQSPAQTQKEFLQEGENNTVDISLQNMNNKKKSGVILITLLIQSDFELNQKLSQLEKQIKQANQKINLKLVTYFQNYQALLSFCTKFLKFGQELFILSWTVKGYFDDNKEQNIIGELVSRFSNLHKLEFNIASFSFSNNAAQSFSNGLKQLTKLSILRFNVYEGFGIRFKDRISKSNSIVCSAISTLPNLQFLQSMNKQIQFLSPLPPNQASFTYLLNTQRQNSLGLPSTMRQDNDFTKQANILTNVWIRNYSYDDSKEKYYINDIKKISDLPYLTSLNKFKDNGSLPLQINKLIDSTKRLALTRMINILIQITFKKEMHQFIPINPVMFLTDLWID